MKKIAAAALCAVLLLCLLPVSALASEGDIYNDGTLQYTEMADGTLAVTGYVGGGGAVVIPSAYDPGGGSMDVTAIGANAFNDKDTITSVTISASVTWIGDYAFENCSSLNSVTLSPGLTVIGYYMFHACDALTSVTIPSSVTSIGRSAFANCGNLSSVTLSDGLSTIGDFMFGSCAALTSITIPSSVTTAGDSPFAFCGLSSVTLSDGLTVIGNGMFFGCEALTSITIPSSMTMVGDSAFQYCSSLQKAVIHSKTVTLGLGSFSDTNIAADGIYGFSGSTAQAYAATYTIPFHAFLEVAYDSQGGSSVPSGYVLDSGDTVDAPDDPTLDGHVFGGWYPTAACDTTAVTFPYAVTADTTLYAKWTELTLNSSVASGKIYTGGRITLTPNFNGGEWDWDEDYLSATFNSPATFTGLKAGTTTVTYTVDGVSTTYDVTIETSGLPSTGQNYTWVWALCGAALALAVAGMRRRTAKKVSE